uniref:Translation initiation factor 5A n=2 Tax=Staphylothermus marinus TaxID=2280 RepID=A0A7J3KG61_STAMA
MSKVYATLGDLKPGNFIVIDNEPCRIVEITKAKTGKHGSAKAHVIAVSLITGSKKTIIAPTDQQVEVPVIEKKVGQIINIREDTVQIMDMETYEVFEVKKDFVDEKVRDKISTGSEVEYWLIMGQIFVMRTR